MFLIVVSSLKIVSAYYDKISVVLKGEESLQK
jgi:hypothetical protein